MSEIILLFVAFFSVMIGVQIITSALDIGFAVADKVLANFGRIMKAPFKIVFKLIALVNKKYTQDRFTVRPIGEITPLELQQMRNTQLRAANNGRSVPVTIEYAQPRRELTND